MSEYNEAIRVCLGSLVALIQERRRQVEASNSLTEDQKASETAFLDELLHHLTTLGGALPYPEDETAEAESEKVASLLEVGIEQFARWPRDNMPEIADNTWRIAAVGLFAGAGAVIGAPAWGAAIGGAYFGGKKFAELVGATVKSTTKPDG